MPMTDPIADMLTRIRNAYTVRKAEVLIPHSKLKLAIAKILEKEKYLGKVEEVEDGQFKMIRIKLRYNNKKSVITSIKRISKVGQRVYVDKQNIPKVLNKLGIAVMSTSKGIISNKDAKKLGVGGEVICEVY